METHEIEKIIRWRCNVKSEVGGEKRRHYFRINNNGRISSETIDHALNKSMVRKSMKLVNCIILRSLFLVTESIQVTFYSFNNVKIKVNNIIIFTSQ